jgi:hypothetical protein
VVARQLVAAVGADEEHRQGCHGTGQRAEEVVAGRVGPLQIVEEDDERPRLARRPENSRSWSNNVI